MNARLCERFDTWYRPELFVAASFFRAYTLRPKAAKQHMIKNDVFIPAC